MRAITILFFPEENVPKSQTVTMNFDLTVGFLVLCSHAGLLIDSCLN